MVDIITFALSPMQVDAVVGYDLALVIVSLHKGSVGVGAHTATDDGR